jgi:hypothetical protein
VGFALAQRPTALRRFSCEGKQRFFTSGAADIAALAAERTSLRNRGRKGAQVFNRYQCRYCGQWHLTTARD